MIKGNRFSVLLKSAYHGCMGKVENKALFQLVNHEPEDNLWQIRVADDADAEIFLKIFN